MRDASTWGGISTALAMLSVAVVALLTINHLIRRSLAAPRVAESGVPDGLPWRQVAIASVRGNQQEEIMSRKPGKPRRDKPRSRVSS
jgi:hypothetical protein